MKTEVLLTSDPNALRYAVDVLRYGGLVAFPTDTVYGVGALAFHRESREPSSLDHQRKTQREIGIGAQIISDLNIKELRLLTNHPRRVAALEGYGIRIVEQVPIPLEKKLISKA